MIKIGFQITSNDFRENGRLIFLILCCFLIILISNLLLIKNDVLAGLQVINPTSMQIFMPQEDKICYQIGPSVCDYYKFIRLNTPPDAVILIPPQGFPWPMTGNMAYSRYFLYPRRILSGEEKKPGRDLIKEKVSYVLLAWGETENTEYDFTHGWPKFSLPAKEIIYRNDQDSSTPLTLTKDYHPGDPENLNAWGLIVLDKGRLK